MQASFWGHSEFETHSGLHPGGEPINEGKQEQIAWPLFWRHWLLGPHGDGTHGLVFGGSEIWICISKLLISVKIDWYNPQMWQNYLQMVCRRWMDCRTCQPGTCIRQCGCALHMWHPCHKFLGKDQHIYFADKLYSADIRRWLYIRVCTWHMDRRDTRLRKYKRHFCNWHLDRMDWARMDLFLYLRQELYRNKQSH